MSIPFEVQSRGDGVLWLDASADAQFRRLLIGGVPACLRPKMSAALSSFPEPDAQAKAMAFYGERVTEVSAMTRPLIDELDALLERKGSAGFCDWLMLSGYADHLPMIEVMLEWASMRRGN